MDFITKDDFNEKIAQGPSVVMFVRGGCQVCELVAPNLEELEEEYKGRMAFYKVDVRPDKELMDTFSLNGVPQVLFFKDGKYIGKMAGPHEKEDYQEKVELVLNL